MRKFQMAKNFKTLARFKSVHISQPSSPHSVEDLKKFSNFTPRTRDQQLRQVMAEPDYDILIIGGGATGAGALLSASRKGFKALLIDSNDFAAGTSSKSTKLLHGGLRYLENAFKLHNNNRMEDFHLVNESLNERDMLLNNVPYLNEQVGMIIPLKNVFEAMFYYCGCMVYHQFAKIHRNGISGLFKNYDEHRYPFQVSKPNFLLRNRLHSMVPALAAKYKYGVLLFDGQCDDSSLVVESLLTATSFQDPAVKSNEALNYTRLISFIKNESGKITGAKLADNLTGKEFSVNCHVAVNATGIFGDKIKLLANDKAEKRLAFAKGDHIALNNSNEEFLRHNLKNIGVFIPKTKDGRVMFVLPWTQSVIAGTTDKIVTAPIIHPLADSESVAEIVSAVKDYFPHSEFKVNSKWSGIRPLVKDLDSNNLESRPIIDNDTSKIKNDGDHNKEKTGTFGSDKDIQTKDLKRVHVVDIDAKTDLITLYGGKLTIFRKMGEDAINEASLILKRRNFISQARFEESQMKTTENLRLIGDFRKKLNNDYNLQKYDIHPDLQFKTRDEYMSFLIDFFGKEFSFVSEDIISYLAKRYGHRALMILEKMSDNRSTSVRIENGYPYTPAEIEHVIQSEFVVKPIDVLMRRLRISFTEANVAKKILPVVIELFAKIHVWDAKREEEEHKTSIALLEKMEF
jgi:glycerol-3-phosphate dehydrogenase